MPAPKVPKDKLSEPVEPKLSPKDLYAKAYKTVFDKLPFWKQDVIRKNENHQDRVIVEFAKEVILLAEDEKFS